MKSANQPVKYVDTFADAFCKNQLCIVVLFSIVLEA